MVDLAIAVFLSILYCYIPSSKLSEKRFRTRSYSLGRCICIINSFYGNVADDKEKSGKLVLVDRHEYCIHPIILCKRICFHQYLLYYTIDHGGLWFARMEKKSPAKSCLKK